MRFKILGAIIIVLVVALSSNNKSSEKYAAPNVVSGNSQLNAQIQSLMKDGQYDAAFPLIESAIIEQEEKSYK